MARSGQLSWPRQGTSWTRLETRRRRPANRPGRPRQANLGPAVAVARAAPWSSSSFRSVPSRRPGRRRPRRRASRL